MHSILIPRNLLAATLAAILGASAASAFAAPALSVLHTLTQSDGSVFQARQWGDEFLSGWETEDGYTIVFDQALKAWTFAELDSDGALVSSGKHAGQPAPSAAPHLRPNGKALSLSARSRNARQGFASLPPGVKTVTPRGAGNVLTVLANFSDTQPTYTKANFDSAYFSGSKSLPAYFSEQSRGLFTVSAGPAGVADWVSLAKPKAYYGADDPSNKNNKDMNRNEIINEVVAALNQRNFDFSPYDGNGDCFVDSLSIIYQGLGQHESGDTNDIWPVQTFASPPETNSACPSGGKIKVSNVSFQAEQSNSITRGGQASYSTFAHEYGHALGLPDLYDTTYASNGVGNWSLMSDGDSKNGDGKPVGLDAWSKYYLGWVTPTVVTSRLQDTTIEPVLASGKVYQFFTGTPTSGEYFLIENRDRSGYDANLQGSGLFVWHIDGGVVKTQYDANKVNDAACIPGAATCPSQHFGVALIQADNLWNLENKQNPGDAGDPFPGSANITNLSDITSPSLKLYSGAPSGLSILNIHASGANMIATLDPGSTAASDADRIFNWAEFKFPQFFPKGATTQSLQGYTFRYYPSTGTYLATKDGRVIVHNGRDWNLLDAGAISDFLPQAAADKF